MAISLRCPTGHALKVPTTLAGKRVRCPKCGESVQVPQPPKPARPREVVAAAPAASAESASEEGARRVSPPPPPTGSDIAARWRTSDSTFELPSKKASEAAEQAEPHRPPPLPPPRTVDEKSPEVVQEKRGEVEAASPEAEASEKLSPPPLPKVVSAPPPRPETPPENPVREKPRKGRRRSVREALASATPGKIELPSSAEDDSPKSEQPLLQPPLPQEKPRGVRPSRRNVRVVTQLAGGLAVVGVTSMAPGLIGWLGYMRGVGILEPWIWPLMVLGVLQLSYALYLVQLPDWTSIWVVTLVSVLCATLYAMGVGLSVFAGHGSDFALMLGLGNPNAARRALLWCLMLLSLTILVAYFCGRVSHRWQREEILAATKPYLLRGEREAVI